LTKVLILRFFQTGDSLAVVPGVFHLTLVRNTGIAFGFLKEHSGVLLWLITLSLVLLLAWGIRLGSMPGLARTGLSLILGGALGNWIDRLRYGAVVDFLDFRIWPVFNLADSAISIGVGLYALCILFRRGAKEAKT
jgi:signal peptidase II